MSIEARLLGVDELDVVCTPLLTTDPVVFNILATPLREHGNSAEFKAWTVRDADETGLAIQTDRGKPLHVSPMSKALVESLAQTIANERPDLPGVQGEAATASAFAGTWGDVTGIGATPKYGLRLFELNSLNPFPASEGIYQAAGPDDLDNVLELASEFSVEIGEDDNSEIVRRRLLNGQFRVWKRNGQCIAIASRNVSMFGVVRIGTVYTVRTHRSSGIATALVGALSAEIIDEGERAILYTELANPTSNGVYRRLGYHPVQEAIRYSFGALVS